MMTYDELLNAFRNKLPNIDETAFYFKSDPEEIDHYIGYLPEYDSPYWIGQCDIPDGCEYETAEEMFEASVFNGKSIKERWDDIVIFQIGAISVDEWINNWGELLHPPK